MSVGEGGDASHIQQVERMVRNYISKNTIILLVVACSSKSDFYSTTSDLVF